MWLRKSKIHLVPKQHRVVRSLDSVEACAGLLVVGETCVGEVRQFDQTRVLLEGVEPRGQVGCGAVRTARL